MLYYYALLASAVISWGIYRYLQHIQARNKTQSPPDDTKVTATEHEDPLAAYESIEPLRDFDWQSTPPIKIRPFKPKYHLTMALETIPLSDLIRMDNTYLSRIKLRRQLMHDHPKATLACNPVAETAALELYDWLVGTYLPKRFPTCFQLIHKPSENVRNEEQNPSSDHDHHDHGKQTHLLNTITSELIPLQSPTSPLTALKTLSSHIDTDFLILLPNPSPSPSPPSSPAAAQNPNPQDQDQEPPHPHPYHLHAFATTFPSGFSTLSKLSLPLSAIHAPVPSYMPKLSKSMDRFFARLPPGKLAARANWTITSSPELFVESGTHAYIPSSSESESDVDAAAAATAESAEEEREAELQREKEALDVQQMRLRCERQTLFRLPRSGALVFAFKTYTYTLEEVKGEDGGLMGEALAEATEGFLRGSVPEMSFYKRERVWGGVAREFLRG